VCRLKGARLAYNHDLEDIVSWSDHDQIVCRPLYGEPITFKPQFKIILCSNQLPVDDRLNLIEFSSRFVDHPKPNEFQRDTRLSERLQLPRSRQSMMTLLLATHKSYQQRGLVIPKSVQETQTRLLRKRNLVRLPKEDLTFKFFEQNFGATRKDVGTICMSVASVIYIPYGNVAEMEEQIREKVLELKRVGEITNDEEEIVNYLREDISAVMTAPKRMSNVIITHVFAYAPPNQRYTIRPESYRKYDTDWPLIFVVKLAY